MSKATAKVFACMPGEVRRDFRIIVQELAYADGIEVCLYLRDQQAGQRWVMPHSIVTKLNKDALRRLLEQQCVEPVAKLREWERNNPDGRTEAVQAEDTNPEDG